MLEFFPTNYVWNLSANLALCMGAPAGEVDGVCRALRDVSCQGDDAGTVAFFDEWCALADRLVQLAEEDLARGRRYSAGRKLYRASIYYITAERMQHRDDPRRKQAYRQMLDCFARATELGGENCRRVEIPCEGRHLAGVMVAAHAAGTSRPPCVMLFNGLDSTKEMLYGSGLQQALARRGISSIAVDQPGTGEALRLHGMTAVIEAEQWAAKVVSHLQAAGDVDPERIGIGAWSLGGFYAPRAAALEPRIKLCFAWGANFDWGEIQRRRMAREGDRPVPHYWDHVQWVWGRKDQEDFMAFVKDVTLEPIIERIAVPFLVVHGEGDRQIPKEFAVMQYERAVNSPKRELKFFTAREGGVEHCSADNMSNVTDYIADWTAETFAEMGASGVHTG